MAARPSRETPPIFGYAVLVLLAVIILAGGGATGWSECLYMSGWGLLLVIFPTRRSLGKWVNTSIVVIALLALAQFLPLGGFLHGSWWDEARSHGISIPSSITPQPRVSIEALLLLIVSIMVVYRMSDLRLGQRRRKGLLWVFAILVALFSWGAIIGVQLGWRYPFGSPAHTFSYFPNRNQTGIFFAMGGVVSFALAIRSAFRRRPLAALAGAFCTLSCFFAVIASLSRASLILFFFGCVVWLVWGAGVAWRRLAWKISLPILIFLGALLLFYGGTNLDRFAELLPVLGEGGLGFRSRIYLDCSKMVLAEPISGIGLGNFAFLFEQFRDRSKAPVAIIHPESDWLWLGAELGIPGVLAILGSLAALWARSGVKNFRRVDPYRTIALAGFLPFFVHTAVDVSAHRVGSLSAGLLLWGLAARPRPSSVPVTYMAAVGRCLGCLFTVVGVFWLVSMTKGGDGYSRAFAKRFPQRFEEALKNGQAGEATELIDRALALTPFDWKAYFDRARLRLHLLADGPGALADFRRARFLERTSAEVPFYEGVALFRYDPVYALAAWREVLFREAQHRQEMIKQVFRSAWSNDRCRRELVRLSLLHPELRRYYLGALLDGEMWEDFTEAMAHDPDLKMLLPRDQRTVLDKWANSDRARDLVAYLDSRPVMHSLYACSLALAYARLNDFGAACRIAETHMSRVPIPGVERETDIKRLRAAFVASGYDILRGGALLNRQVELEDWSGAGNTIAKLREHECIPLFVTYWQAVVTARQGNFEQSWALWAELRDLLQPESEE